MSDDYLVLAQRMTRVFLDNISMTKGTTPEHDCQPKSVSPH